MIKLRLSKMESLADVQAAVQTAIDLEFSTLPPYLYALYSIKPGANEPAVARLKDLAEEEMIHFCLACNILNAIGGSPKLNVPKFPGTLPGDIGQDENGDPFIVHVVRFSEAAMKQGMRIEEPEDPIDPPVATAAATSVVAPEAGTIGEYYRHLEQRLSQLPPSDWQADRNQIGDGQFFAGQLFKVNNFADASQAISDIVSEGEGSSRSPLDFQGDVSHFYRFEEVFRNRILTKADNDVGYVWGDPLGIDWSAVYPAIEDPSQHDFSQEPPAAQQAQLKCNAAFSEMVDALEKAFNGEPGQLGVGVRQMFALRQATSEALTTPLSDGQSVAGPSFVYLPKAQRGN